MLPPCSVSHLAYNRSSLPVGYQRLRGRPAQLSNLPWSFTSSRLLQPSCCSSNTPLSTHPKAFALFLLPGMFPLDPYVVTLNLIWFGLTFQCHLPILSKSLPSFPIILCPFSVCYVFHSTHHYVKLHSHFIYLFIICLCSQTLKRPCLSWS